MAEPFTEDDWTSDLFRAGAWDIWIGNPPDGPDPGSEGLKLIDTLPEFFIHLGNMYPGEPPKEAARSFMRLPAARAMPPQLKASVEAYLR